MLSRTAAAPSPIAPARATATPPTAPDAVAPPHTSRSQRSTLGRRLAAQWWLLPGLVAYLAFRLPSLLQPHWYTDEAGYAVAGREMLNGKIPYSQVWNNKPPLHLATVGAVVHFFGSSETALHVLTLVAGGIALAAVVHIARHLFGPGTARATVTFLLAGVLLGLPLFDADLAIPESLLIAPATWAAAIIVVRLHQGRTNGIGWAVAAGGLAAVTVCYQQTAVADAGAFGLILLLHPNARLRHFVAYAATGVALTVAWVVPVVVLAGAHTVGFAMVGFYTGDYNLSAVPGAHDASHFLLLALALVLAVAGAVLGRVRRMGPAWMLGVWAVAALLVPAAAQQPFPHFAGPAVLPVLLAAAAAVPGLSVLRRDPGRTLAPLRWLSAAPLVAAVVLAGLMARSAGVDWVPNWASAGTNGYRTLTTYYFGALEAWTGHLSWGDWEKQWDDRSPADTAVADWLRAHNLAGHSAVVWSSDAWPYLLADLPLLLPTPPIYNNFELLGSNGEVTSRVAALAPEIILTSDSDIAEFPEIQSLLKSNYHQVYSAGPDDVFLRDGSSG